MRARQPMRVIHKRSSKLIWRFGQYLPVAFCTLGAAIVSVSTAWDTGIRGSWWLPAVGLCCLALAVELLKPVVVRKGMWLFAGACVLISGLAEYQMVARARASYASGSTVQDASFAANRAANLRRQLDEIDPARTSAELAPLVQSSQEAAGECPVKMGPVQRKACQELPALKSEAARAALREGLEKRIAEVEDAGHVSKSAGKTDEAAALAGLTGLSPQLVDQLLALLLIVLFQFASVGASRALVPEPAGPFDGPLPRENPATAGVGPGWASGLLTAEKIEPMDHELLMTFLRGKGGSYAGSFRELARLIGWSRNKLDRVKNELVAQGRVAVNKNGIALKEDKDGIPSG